MTDDTQHANVDTEWNMAQWYSLALYVSSPQEFKTTHTNRTKNAHFRNFREVWPSEMLKRCTEVSDFTIGGWRDGSAVKSTDCSSRGHEFNSQQPQGGLQLSVVGSDVWYV